MSSFPGLQRNRVLGFGRRQPFTYAMDSNQAPFSSIDDARLFLSTFVGGFLFMTIYLA